MEDKGVGKNEWPVITKYLGLRSTQQFMNEILNRHFSRTGTVREDSAARAHLSVGKGISPLLSFDEPYDAVEIGTYKIEAHVTVAFHTPEGLETDLRLNRLNLIAVVDRFSSAVLAYTVVYRRKVNADDILRVIRHAVSGTWTPMELTIPGLRYPDGGGLPSGVIDGAQGLSGARPRSTVPWRTCRPQCTRVRARRWGSPSIADQWRISSDDRTSNGPSIRLPGRYSSGFRRQPGDWDRVLCIATDGQNPMRVGDPDLLREEFPNVYVTLLSTRPSGRPTTAHMLRLILDGSRVARIV